jgi:hypothetical protein
MPVLSIVYQYYGNYNNLNKQSAPPFLAFFFGNGITFTRNCFDVVFVFLALSINGTGTPSLLSLQKGKTTIKVPIKMIHFISMQNTRLKNKKTNHFHDLFRIFLPQLRIGIIYANAAAIVFCGVPIAAVSSTS